MADYYTDEIPKRGRIRIKDRVSYLKGSIISLFRNKRRSMSMISGLILGISILSGILLYSTVLMNNVYDTVIEGSPYEIRMDFKGGDLTESQYENFRQDLISDIRISDAQFLYGDARTVLESTATSRGMYTLANLKAEIYLEHNNETFDSSGRIFSEPFYISEIGGRMRDQFLTGRESKVYTTDSPYYHGVIISEDLAEAARLIQGTIVRELSLTITIQDPDDFFREDLISTIKLENVTIAGISSIDTGATAGLFSGAFMSHMGSYGEIYLPEELLTDQNQSQFLTDLATNEMRYCVMKINEAEFDLSSPQRVNTQINQLINEYEKENDALIGSNLVEAQLLPFEILSFFVFFFDGVLTVPVAILSLYLLGFGIDLSLQERRYQVGILKTQGASPKQIKRRILVEALLLAIFGLIVGYIISIFGAWGIGTATGFLKWDWEIALRELPDFFVFDQTAFFVVGGLIVLILFFMVNGKANQFIEMEIVESVRRVDETKKPNFLRRNNLDIIFFAIGTFTLILVILQEFFGQTVDFGFFTVIIALLGPPLFWIGGAAVVSRIAVWLPPKMDRVLKRIGAFKDVSILMKGNVFRKSADIPRLSLIIALTVSFSILAAVQGTTGEMHKERLITFDVGADLSINTGFILSTSALENITRSSSSIEKCMALTTTSGTLLNDPVTIHSVDNQKFGTVGKWQSDATPMGKPSKEEIMDEFSRDDTGVLLGKDIIQEKALTIGEKISIEILTYSWNGTIVNYGLVPQNLTIRGVYDHAPGGIGSTGIVIDHSVIATASNLSALAEVFDTLSPILQSLIPGPILTQIEGFKENDPKGILSSRFLASIKKGSDQEEVKSGLLNSSDNKFIVSIKTLQGEIKKSNELSNMDYGIPGLLTADFLISLLAATLATFIFMSILMEGRKKEFAILRSYGASSRQIYKIVFGESIILLLTSVIWGLFVGLGLSVLFNGFFEFIDVFITPFSTLLSSGGLRRRISLDWLMLIITLTITFTAMLLATFFSIRGASKAKISVVVREL